uniref:Uncharacterized protein n=1 Tax=Pavo cristatus TaxID=9049 RepID=A0A8C9G3N5_PAVCR
LLREKQTPHMGQTPAESDFQVLEIARKLEMYGIRFHLFVLGVSLILISSVSDDKNLACILWSIGYHLGPQITE